jgi:RNA polymerase sigma-70 factor (ECF subfamily)
MSGDDDTFDALFNDHFAPLWRFVRRRCATGQDADDITAQVFAIAWRRRGDLHADGEVRLWLFGVARRVLANHRRAGARRDRLTRRLHNTPDNHVDATDTTSVGDIVRSALDGLTELDRTVVVLRMWDGLSVAEIATLLDRSPNSVSIRLHRARRQLADELGAHGLIPRGSRTAEAEPQEDVHVRNR